VLQIQGILAKRKDLIARIKKPNAQALAVHIRWLRIIAGSMSFMNIPDVPSKA